MSYKSILDTKPKKENKQKFCERIATLLSEMNLCSFDNVYNGKNMINELFKLSNNNGGFKSIDDLLNEYDNNYTNIFELAKRDNELIDEQNILANIDIIINCLFPFKPQSNIYFYDEEKALCIYEIIGKAIEEYLLVLGYKISKLTKDRYVIIENSIKIDVNEIKNNNIKEDILEYYNYKNINNLHEKKKILESLISELDGKNQDIERIIGKKAKDALGNYSNNINIRHNNKDITSKYYKETVAALSDNELIKWYDYI